MPVFTNNEYYDMVIIYGECRENSRRAANLYQQRFPQRQHPSHETIRNIALRDTGTFSHRPRTGRPRRDDTVILAYFYAHPHASTREVSADCGISHVRVWDILNRNGMHPYSCFLQQTLQLNDYPRRFDWCNFMLNELHANPAFLTHILWSDESKFTQDGVVNRHNVHYWADTNPHWNRNDRNQVRWSLNVWCGMWRNRIVGPFIYGQNLNGQRYLRILQDTVQNFLYHIPLNDRLNMWFQQDGAPAHKPLAVRRWLNNTFRQHWMGEGGPVAWPPRSPDLTPLDFFLWGHVKQLVYVTPPQDVNDLEQRILDAFAQIDGEAIIEAAIRNVIVRAEHCVVANGGHFEFALR
jgi:hypothetical protein